MADRFKVDGRRTRQHDRAVMDFVGSLPDGDLSDSSWENEVGTDDEMDAVVAVEEVAVAEVAVEEVAEVAVEEVAVEEVAVEEVAVEEVAEVAEVSDTEEEEVKVAEVVEVSDTEEEEKVAYDDTIFISQFVEDDDDVSVVERDDGGRLRYVAGIQVCVENEWRSGMRVLEETEDPEEVQDEVKEDVFHVLPFRRSNTIIRFNLTHRDRDEWDVLIATDNDFILIAELRLLLDACGGEKRCYTKAQYWVVFQSIRDNIRPPILLLDVMEQIMTAKHYFEEETVLMERYHLSGGEVREVLERIGLRLYLDTPHYSDYEHFVEGQYERPEERKDIIEKNVPFLAGLPVTVVDVIFLFLGHDQSYLGNYERAFTGDVLPLVIIAHHHFSEGTANPYDTRSVRERVGEAHDHCIMCRFMLFDGQPRPVEGFCMKCRVVRYIRDKADEGMDVHAFIRGMMDGSENLFGVEAPDAPLMGDDSDDSNEDGEADEGDEGE
jgi:hypothetical protein